MTEEKQNILIYKLLGYEPRRMWRYWTDKEKTRGGICIYSKEDTIKSIEHLKDSWFYKEYPNEYFLSEPEEYDDWSNLPSVDLDLLHEVENTLNKNKLLKYHQELQDMFPFSMHSPTPAISAKVEERREALLKTLNLWE